MSGDAKTSIRLSSDDLEILERIAAYEGTSVSALIRRAIKRMLREEECL